MIKISAIVCTFKRPDYLRQALHSLCNQTLDRGEYEVIIVDNAVQSEAEKLVAEFQDGNVNLRYVTERSIGLSLARNKGLQEARGRYVAYLDDDARADQRWLEVLLNAFEIYRPAPAAIGGRVWLDWQGKKPAWVPNEQLSIYTYVDHGDEAHPLRNDEYLVGANLAFAKEALQATGGFNAHLGRQGKVLLSGEEAQILQALRDRGLGILYQPEAVVWHSVHPSRKKPVWLVRRMFWDGASQPLLDRTAGRSRRKILRGVGSDLRQCASASVRVVSAWAGGSKTMAWQAILGLAQRAGRVRTQLRLIASIDG